jgi:hypothetical protein
MFLPIAAGQFCLLSHWLVAGIWAFHSGFPKPFKNFPAACLYPFSSVQRLSNSLEEHFPMVIS